MTDVIIFFAGIVFGMILSYKGKTESKEQKKVSLVVDVDDDNAKKELGLLQERCDNLIASMMEINKIATQNRK